MPNETQRMHTDFDHTSFAVHNALDCASRLREDYGATPIIGETLAEFRYLMLYVGSEERGTKIEFIEPTNDGFVNHYLEKRGESAHHLTFAVQNLKDVVTAARKHGFGVVDENYDHVSWQEAFIRPDATHRTIIQLASSDRQYPPAQQLFANQHRDPLTMPHIHNATDRQWWTSIWETQSGSTIHLGPTVLKSADMERSHTLFGTILQGQPNNSHVPGGLVYTWPSGAVEIIPTETAGIVGIRAHDTGEILDIETMTTR